VKRRALHTVLAPLLALLVLFGGTAKEAFHALAPHTDTEHRHNEADGPAFEPEHHHCGAVSEFLPFFDVPAQPALTFWKPRPVRILAGVVAASLLPRRAPAEGCLRGPPVA